MSGSCLILIDEHAPGISSHYALSYNRAKAVLTPSNEDMFPQPYESFLHVQVEIDQGIKSITSTTARPHS